MKNFVPIDSEKDRMTYEEQLVSMERGNGGEWPWSLHVIPTSFSG